MAGDEQAGTEGVEPGTDLRRVATRIAADVRHHHPRLLYLETGYFREARAELLPVDIPVHGNIPAAGDSPHA